MKNAYSNILGTYVEAAEVEHADTAPFQVVCPCCAESVFKVERPLSTGSVSEFFSHRQGDPASVAACERRVGGLGKAEMERRNAQGRDQNLRVFLSVVRDAIDLQYDRAVELMACRDWHRRLGRHPGFLEMRDFVASRHVTRKGEQLRRMGCQDYATWLRMSGERLETSFGIEFQKRAAGDVMRHMLTREGLRNYGHLLGHAMAQVSLKEYSVGTEAEPGPTVPGRTILRPVLEVMAKVRPGECREGLIALAREQSRFSDRLSTGGLFYKTVTYEMMSALMMLPYREILTNHAARRPLLRGVELRKSSGGQVIGIASPELMDESQPRGMAFG